VAVIVTLAPLARVIEVLIGLVDPVLGVHAAVGAHDQPEIVTEGGTASLNDAPGSASW
jgi:hypothetical protein